MYFYNYYDDMYVKLTHSGSTKFRGIKYKNWWNTFQFIRLNYGTLFHFSVQLTQLWILKWMKLNDRKKIQLLLHLCAPVIELFVWQNSSGMKTNRKWTLPCYETHKESTCLFDCRWKRTLPKRFVHCSFNSSNL